MSYFLSGIGLSGKGEITLSGPEARHILLSRRVKPGEKIQLQDPFGLRIYWPKCVADRKTGPQSRALWKIYRCRQSQK